MNRFTDKTEMLRWVSEKGATLIVQGQVAAFQYSDLARENGYPIKMPITYKTFFEEQKQDEVYVFADVDLFLFRHGVSGYGFNLNSGQYPDTSL